METIVTLEHGTFCVSSYSWVIRLSLSHTNSMCHHTFLSSRRVLLFSSHYILGTRRVNASKSVFMPHHVQGKFHFKPSICSITSFHFLVSVHTHSIHHLTSLSCVSFMSMMGDTSRPSFDESFPIDFNTLSKN
jgi:hypothetical protein